MVPCKVLRGCGWEAPSALLLALMALLLGRFKQRLLHFHCKSAPSPSPLLGQGHKGSSAVLPGWGCSATRGLRLPLVFAQHRAPAAAPAAQGSPKFPCASSRVTQVESGDRERDRERDRDSTEPDEAPGSSSWHRGSAEHVPHPEGRGGTQPTWHWIYISGIHEKNERELFFFPFFFPLVSTEFM